MTRVGRRLLPLVLDDGERESLERLVRRRKTVSRIWRAFDLQLHRVETFRLSNDPLFVEKVRDIVGLHMSPPDSAVLLCVDEKSQIRALERTQPLLPVRPGQPEKRTHDDLRQLCQYPGRPGNELANFGFTTPA